MTEVLVCVSHTLGVETNVLSAPQPECLFPFTTELTETWQMSVSQAEKCAGTALSALVSHLLTPFPCSVLNQPEKKCGATQLIDKS